jgi:AcrR family transcriptional regulator
MDTPAPNERGWRGSADLWLDAAYQLLVEGGVEAVKVMPLAEKLGLSRTSFYWHFADREALLDGLVARWQSRNTANLMRQTEAPAATITEAVLNLFDCWIIQDLFDSRLEFAIRTWALTDPALAKTLAAADATRIAAIKTMFLRFGYPDAEADIRAHTVYLTQIGYISMRVDEPLLPRLDRIPPYALTFTGHAPSTAEVKSFRDRHIEAGHSRANRISKSST